MTQGPNRSLIPAWVDGRLRPVDKLEAHKLGLRHKAVSVFIFCGDHLLLQRRAPGKYHTPGLWTNTCCTHPFMDESAADCAYRRVKEELGLTAPTLHHRGQVEYRADVGSRLIENEVVDVFTGVTETRPALAPDPEEICDTAWVTPEALLGDLKAHPDRYTPWLRIYLSDHRDMILTPIHS